MARRANSDLVITASVDNQATPEFKGIGDAALQMAHAIAGTEVSFTELNSAAEVFGKTLDVVAGAVRFVIDTVSEWAKEAMEAEKAERDLAIALSFYGDAAKDALPHSKALANQIQQSTGTSADAIVQMQAMLLSLGVLPKNLDAATTAALGWSRVMGKDFKGAGLDVVQVLHGHIPRSLHQLQPDLKTTADAIAFMGRGMQFLAEDGQTLEGRLNILRENFGDFKEGLGGILTQNDKTRGAVSELNDVVLKLADDLSGDRVKSAFTWLTDKLSEIAGLAIKGVGVVHDDIKQRIDDEVTGYELRKAQEKQDEERERAEEELLRRVRQREMEHMKQLEDMVPEHARLGASLGEQFNAALQRALSVTPEEQAYIDATIPKPDKGIRAALGVAEGVVASHREGAYAEPRPVFQGPPKPAEQQHASAESIKAAEAEAKRIADIRHAELMDVMAQSREAWTKANKDQERAKLNSLKAEEDLAKAHGEQQDLERKHQAELEIAADEKLLRAKERKEREHVQRMTDYAQMFASASATLLEDAFTGAFDRIGEDFLRLVQRMAMQLVEAQLFSVFSKLLGIGVSAAATVATGGAAAPAVVAGITTGGLALAADRTNYSGLGTGGAALGAAAPRAGTTIIHHHNHYMVPPTSAQTERNFIAGVVPTLKKLKRKGLL